MRTYGEGFVIADQSPGLLDLSVIRNTNTKIIMRLPALEDRELVGKAIGLNTLQITELSKLPTGVAAVYQNDWLSAVLAKIPYFHVSEGTYVHYWNKRTSSKNNVDESNLLNAIMLYADSKSISELLLDKNIDTPARLSLPTKVKYLLIKYIKNPGKPKIEGMGTSCRPYGIRHRAAVLHEAHLVHGS